MRHPIEESWDGNVVVHAQSEKPFRHFLRQVRHIAWRDLKVMKEYMEMNNEDAKKEVRS